MIDRNQGRELVETIEMILTIPETIKREIQADKEQIKITIIKMEITTMITIGRITTIIITIKLQMCRKKRWKT